MEDTSVTPELVLRAGLEFLLLLGLVVGLFTLTDLRRRLHPLGTAAMSVLLVFLLSWGAAQMLDRWQYAHPQQVSFVPLTRFAMYQAQLSESVSETYAWSARTRDGRVRDVNIAAQFATVGLPPLSTRMRILLNDVHEPTSPQEYDEALAELALYAQAVDAALREDGVDATAIRFARVTGSVADPTQEVLVSWPTERLRDDA